MIVKEVLTYKEFILLKKEWNSLTNNSSSGSVFLSHEWFDCWWISHSNNNKENLQLLILLVQESSGKTIGIFPFLRSSSPYRNISARKIEYLQSGLTPYIDFILADDLVNKKSIINAALSHLLLTPKWDILKLNNFSVNNENYAALLEQLRCNNILFGTSPGLKTPLIATKGDWNEFFASRPVKFRKSMRNKLNRMKKNPDITIEKYTDPQQIITFALPHVFSIAKKSWKARDKHSFVDFKAYASFFTLFTETAAPYEWIIIWLLKYKDSYIAYEYHIKNRNEVYPLSADYDENYKNMSPGSILEYHIIKTLFEDTETHIYNTCANDYKYLQNWTDNFQTHINIEIFSPRIPSYFFYFLKYKLVPQLRKISFITAIKKELENKNLWFRKNLNNNYFL